MADTPFRFKGDNYFINPLALCMFTQKELQVFGPKLDKYMSIFHPLEVVDRDSEPQLQADEKNN